MANINPEKLQDRKKSKELKDKGKYVTLTPELLYFKS